MAAAQAAAAASAGVPAGAAVIDCDVHAVVPSIDALYPWLDPHWREIATTTQFRGPTDTAYPPGAASSLRPDLAGIVGPAASLAAVRERSLDPWGVEAAILTCTYGVEAVHNPDAAAALARAVNAWLVAEWLEPEPRLRGSIVVPGLVPADVAANEIDRVGEHPAFVQVLLPVRSQLPYGHRRYWPIFEAAHRHDLPVALQFGGAPGGTPTAAGWPSTTSRSTPACRGLPDADLMSLVVEGVFDHFPKLRIAMIEGGWTWLPSLMWRIDKDWKGCAAKSPGIRRRPPSGVPCASACASRCSRSTHRPIRATCRCSLTSSGRTIC